MTVAVGDVTSLTNTATGGASGSFDTNTNNNSATIITAVTPLADLEVQKFGPATVMAGTSVSYMYCFKLLAEPGVQSASWEKLPHAPE